MANPNVDHSAPPRPAAKKGKKSAAKKSGKKT